ncbi:glycosyltransferase family 4 protein [Vibrio algarum]|uniref:Glycosyltransferase family 1 protein n=1 Tax=Vibrio algarum TaxID=3020714 RepID=A0ABT4YLJ5_9VIBR|nr:glycosyltransferase family 1 protein [Vibrio sp. KJ40-1]MDB1122412.1 glycosyltransferase family 1 protein [Vibrio sp. KJ40-1]
MRIAIDARPLSRELAGIGRYTYNVLKELFILDKKNTYYLYTDCTLKFDFSTFKNVNVREGNINSTIGSVIFSQCVFPYWIKKDNINTFWSPRHHLPLITYLMPNINKVVTIHDIVWKVHPETMPKSRVILEKLLFTPSLIISDKIISISKFTKNELVSNFDVPKNKISITQLASFIGPLGRSNIVNQEKLILFIGTLEPRKNLENLCIAFKKLIDIEKYSNYKLVIVGGKGWGNLNLNALIEKLSIIKNVEIKGFISDQELVELYASCEVLTMPSVYEGFGLPALEALSMKKRLLLGRRVLYQVLKVTMFSLQK